MSGRGAVTARLHGLRLSGLRGVLTALSRGPPSGDRPGFLAALCRRPPLRLVGGDRRCRDPLVGRSARAVGGGCLRRFGEDLGLDGDYRLARGSLEVKGSVQEARVGGVDRNVESLGCLVHADPVV